MEITENNALLIISNMSHSSTSIGNNIFLKFQSQCNHLWFSLNWSRYQITLFCIAKILRSSKSYHSLRARPRDNLTTPVMYFTEVPLAPEHISPARNAHFNNENIYTGGDYSSQTLIQFDWYNPNPYQRTTGIIKKIFKSPVFFHHVKKPYSN